MRLVVVKILCLFMFSSCKPIARQEEPISKDEFAIALRTILRSIVNPIRGSKAAVRVMTRGVAQQKSYESLASQLQDIWWEVLDVRKSYVRGIEREVGGFIEYPQLSAAHQVETLKNQAHADYRNWAAGVAKSVQEALDTNKLYRPSKPDMKTGLTGGHPLYHPETVSDIMTDAKKVLNLLESQLEF